MGASLPDIRSRRDAYSSTPPPSLTLPSSPPPPLIEFVLVSSMDADREEAAVNPESCDFGASGVGSNGVGCFEPKPNMFANEFFLAPIPPEEEATPGIECPNLYSEFEPPPPPPSVPEPKSCSAEDFPHVPPRIPTHLESRIAGAITIPTPSTRAIPLIKTMIFEGSSHRNSVVVDEAALSCEPPTFSNFPLAANLCGENFLKPPSIQDVRDTTALTARLNDDSASNATAALRYESKHSRSFSSEKMVSANALGTMKPNIFALAIA
mmetsp:Transcript_7971/g.25067  ORF Transcript_7971/g.25067 Transcript_7971/m.25067 type:complete len:266 (-) Transcript_7971:3118-3915(-)